MFTFIIYFVDMVNYIFTTFILRRDEIWQHFRSTSRLALWHYKLKAFVARFTTRVSYCGKVLQVYFSQYVAGICHKDGKTGKKRYSACNTTQC